MPINPPQFILITDRSRMEREAFFVAVEASLRGGVDAVMVREKDMDSARLLAFSARLREMTRTYAARLIIHTQADIACAVAADGVHVSAASMHEISSIRRWCGSADISISASCHSSEELASAASQTADFVLLSSVFPTGSHPGMAAMGERKFMTLAERASLPVVALGGITPENRHHLASFGIAAISAILDAKDPEQVARRMQCPSTTQ